MALDVPEVIGSVISASNESPIVVSASSRHGLNDGEEVKIDGAEGNASVNGSFYVKVSGQTTTAFALYSDSGLTEPVAGTGNHQTGGTIYRPLSEDSAIVVGINRYRNPPFAQLRGAEADAVSFQKWLISPQGGMVAMSRVDTILSSNYPAPSGNGREQPALDDLKQAFIRHAETAYRNERNNKGSRVGRRLYIFLSGHGVAPDRTAVANRDYTVALLPANTSEVTYGDHLLGPSWAEWFRDAAAFDEIILFMDCCRDRKDLVTPAFCPLDPLPSDRREFVRTFYATASELDSSSWEQDFGNPPQRHGVFSYAIMEALQSDSLRNSDGWLMCSQLKLYLENRVPRLRADQNPKVILDASKDIAFFKRRALKPNLCVTFAPSCAGKQVQLFGGTLDAPKHTHTANGNPWCLWVEPRVLYKLSIPNGDSKQFGVDGSKEVENVEFP